MDPGGSAVGHRSATRCRFVWITDVLPDELAERLGELMDGGMRAMKRALEAAATGS